MLSHIKNKLSWAAWPVLASVFVFLSWYFLRIATIQQGGDIAEYYGMTQTLIAEQSLALSPTQETTLKENLHPAYFDNPGYYIHGRNDNRYPVHFFAYSLLAVPVRLGLVFFQANPLKSLWLFNVLSLVVAIGVIWKKYVKALWPRLALLGIVLISPLMSFFAWPGPDLWYLSLLMIAIFAFLNKEKRFSVLLTVIASWHSQPLIVLAGLMAVYDILSSSSWKLSKAQQKVTLNISRIWQYLLIGSLGFIPYAYNLYAFGSLTPWTILQDGWTQIRGFGLHNASLKKSYEQLFDLNVGQFWYAPLLYILSIFALIRAGLKKQWERLVLVLLFIITAIFYQTNPGWHYGTSGFGPGRHGLLYLPLAIALTFQVIKKKTFWASLILTMILVVHGLALSFNNYLEPDLTKTLHHSVFAEYTLENYPELYNPTPEIFVDRTNHDDQTLPTTAVYKNGEGECVKAWVLLSDKDLLEQECGNLSDDQTYQLDNRFKKASNITRQVLTTEATFWPYSDACADWFYKTEEKPFECAQTIDQFIKLTGITDVDRIATLDEFPYPGIWKLRAGDPILITIPPGYIIDYRALDGVYVNFTQTN